MTTAFDTLDVRDFVRQAEQTGQVLTRQGLYEFEGFDASRPFACQWRIAKKTYGLEIQGHLEGELNLICDSCQQPFLYPVALDIQEMYVFERFVEDQGSQEKQLQPEDFYESIGEDSQIDLKNLIHQYLIIETTHNPTCDQDTCPSQQ